MRSSPRFASSFALSIGLALVSFPAFAQTGGFRVELASPASVLVDAPSLDVEGRASIFGGVQRLDLFLVMDTSKSLRKTDPDDRRSAGAISLVRSLFWSDTQIGVVDFDREARVLTPLTGDRTVVMEALGGLDQNGRTNLAEGMRAALAGFDEGGREDAVRMMLVFTDGKTKPDAARRAMVEARKRGVSISTLMLGSNAEGEAILRDLADGTGGRFVAVQDPDALPDAFLDLRSTGVARVEVKVNDGDPVLADIARGAFAAEVPLDVGENRIIVTATSVDGRVSEDAMAVTRRAPGCAELRVRAERAGQPALSISKRGVEIIVDASGSMWGQMEDRTKIAIAKEILHDALSWLPPDLRVALRAYGHLQHRNERDCTDTDLLVPLGVENREEIRAAVRSLQPKGQTPLGYALGRVSEDFGDFDGERAVVLVTDGLESCGGDARIEASRLQGAGPLPIHVIGFGLEGKAEHELASLRAIADASGGKFARAGSGAELTRALGTTVGTAYAVWHEGEPVARSALGAGDTLRLPAGEYRLRVESVPPYDVPLVLASSESATLVLRPGEREVAHSVIRGSADYASCAEPRGHLRLGARNGARDPGQPPDEQDAPAAMPAVLRPEGASAAEPSR